MDKYDIFVYGTLKRGYGHGFIIDERDPMNIFRSCFKGPAKLHNYHQPILTNIHPAQGSVVHGEFYQGVPEHVMWVLDNIEGHPVAWRRRKLEIEFDGEPREAWVYIND